MIENKQIKRCLIYNGESRDRAFVLLTSNFLCVICVFQTRNWSEIREDGGIPQISKKRQIPIPESRESSSLLRSFPVGNLMHCASIVGFRGNHFGLLDGIWIINKIIHFKKRRD